MTRPTSVGQTLSIPCPAKVNLALSVGPPRPSDGYHPIASWMVAVDFFDTVTLRVVDEVRQPVKIRFADDAPRPQAIDWPVERDLSYQALKLLESRVGRALPVEIEVTKRIPTGAGLGGGSADAAGVLVGVNRLLELGLTRDVLQSLGAQLGCDVAFAVGAIDGQASAVATGLGEKLEPASLRQVVHLVLMLPEFGCPTAPVYGAFDALGGESGVDEGRVRELANAKPQAAELFNDLANAAIHLQPRLGESRAALREALGTPIHITGSGAAMFALSASREEAQQLAVTAEQVEDIVALAVSTLPAD